MKLNNIFQWFIALIVANMFFLFFSILTQPACFNYDVMPKGCFTGWLIKSGELLLLLAFAFYAGLYHRRPEK